MQIRPGLSNGYGKWLTQMAKFFITVVLLVLVLSEIKTDQLISVMTEIKWVFVISAIFVTIGQTLLLSWRWHRVVGFLGSAVGMLFAIRLSFVGVFMNQVLPTSIGGDVFRVWGLHHRGVVGGVALTSVFIDRVTGLLSLSLLVSMATAFVWSNLNDELVRYAILSTSPVILSIIMLCNIIDRYQFGFLNRHVIRLTGQLADGMRKVSTSISVFGELLALGALASTTGLMAVFLLSKAIGIEVTLLEIISLAGAVTLLSVLPVSLGGWGVREASMVTMLATVDVPIEKSLLLSVLYGVIMIIAALPGGFFLLNGSSSYKKAVSESGESVGTNERIKPLFPTRNFSRIGETLMNRLKMVAEIVRSTFVDKLFGTFAWIYFMFLLGLIVSVVVVGPNIGGDSTTYINHWPTRSPVYPIILDLFRGHYSLLVAVQAVSGVVSILYFCGVLRSILNLSSWVTLFASFLLLTPYFPIGYLNIANSVGTESISYSLFLISVALFIQGLFYGNNKYIIFSCGVLLILMLTRKQFVFVYPVYIVILLLRQVSSKSFLLIGIVFFSFFAGSAIERVYNGLSSGHYTGVPFTGIQLVIRPLWIATQVDAELFEGIEKKVFESTLRTMNEHKVSLSSCKESALPIQCGYHHFLESYNVICWQILYPTLKQYGVNDWWEIDKITLSISYKLIRAHLFTYSSEYYSAVKNGDGPFYMILLVVVFFWAFLQSIKYDHLEYRIALMLTMMSLANILMVCIVEPLLQRYTFYTSFLQIAFMLILISREKKYQCAE